MSEFGGLWKHVETQHALTSGIIVSLLTVATIQKKKKAKTRDIWSMSREQRPNGWRQKFTYWTEKWPYGLLKKPIIIVLQWYAKSDTDFWSISKNSMGKGKWIYLDYTHCPHTHCPSPHNGRCISTAQPPLIQYACRCTVYGPPSLHSYSMHVDAQSTVHPA